MHLSFYVLTCHLSFHPRLYRYQRVMLTPTGSAQGGRRVSVEQFLVCSQMLVRRIHLSSYVSTCHLSFHPRLYKYVDTHRVSPGGGAGGLLNTVAVGGALNFRF